MSSSFDTAIPTTATRPAVQKTERSLFGRSTCVQQLGNVLQSEDLRGGQGSLHLVCMRVLTREFQEVFPENVRWLR